MTDVFLENCMMNVEELLLTVVLNELIRLLYEFGTQLQSSRPFYIILDWSDWAG